MNVSLKEMPMPPVKRVQGPEKTKEEPTRVYDSELVFLFPTSQNRSSR